MGTGGGVPGVILAIVRPDLKVALSESMGKKAKVVAEIVEQLKLPVKVYPLRAEKVLETERFDTLVVRAVDRLRKLLQWFRPHWPLRPVVGPQRPRMGGQRGEARHYGLMHELSLRKLKSYPLPGTESESVLLRGLAEAVGW